MSNNNNDQLYADKFRMVFSEIPLVAFNTRQISIPDISNSPIENPNPLNYTSVPGSKLRYADLSITFRVDEDLKNYKELHRWLIGMTAPQNSQQFKKFQEEFRQSKISGTNGNQYSSDATVTTLTNVDNINIKVAFKNIFPISLSGLELGIGNNQVVDANAVFRYDWYEFL